MHCIKNVNDKMCGMKWRHLLHNLHANADERRQRNERPVDFPLNDVVLLAFKRDPD